LAYDEGLAERLREIFADRYDFDEKRMFGGIAFMIHGHMCCGIVGDTLMARVGPNQYDAVLKRKHARKMDFTGKPMRGFIFVDPAGFESDRDLQTWVTLCENYVNSLPPK